MSSTVVIQNRTPHDPLRIWRGDELLLELPAAGAAARLTERLKSAGHLTVATSEIPTVQVTYGEASDLPDPAENTVIVVSQLVCEALPERTDLYFPAGLVRNGHGDIIGCTTLARRASAASRPE